MYHGNWKGPTASQTLGGFLSHNKLRSPFFSINCTHIPHWPHNQDKAPLPAPQPVPPTTVPHDLSGLHSCHGCALGNLQQIQWCHLGIVSPCCHYWIHPFTAWAVSPAGDSDTQPLVACSLYTTRHALVQFLEL